MNWQYLVLRGYLSVKNVMLWKAQVQTPLKFYQGRLCFYFCFDGSNFMHIFHFYVVFLTFIQFIHC